MRRRVVATVLVAACCLVACTPDGPQTPSPSPSASSALPTSVSPTPSPTPTLSPLQQAVFSTFITYWKVTDEAANRGGADELPGDVARLVTGPERAYQTRNLRDLKRRGFAGKGHGKVSNLKLLKPLTTTTREAFISACVDQTGLFVTKNGQPYPGRPAYLAITKVTMRLEGKSWKVADLSSEKLEKGLTCADFF